MVEVSLASSFRLSWAPLDGFAPPSPYWLEYFQTVAGATVPDFSDDIRTCTGNATNVWGASFDDGPSENTPIVLDYFRNVGMKATFWVVGSQVTKFPETLLAAYNAGHEIGHPDLVTLSEDEVVAELVYGAKAIYEVTGRVPRYFRPPYGSINDDVRQIATLMGLQAVTWSQDSEDWSYVGTSEMYQVPLTFESWLDDGVEQAISLQHDLNEETVSVVKESMDILINAGRVIKPLTECIGAPAGSAYQNPVLQEFFQSGQFENGLLADVEQTTADDTEQTETTLDDSSEETTTTSTDETDSEETTTTTTEETDTETDAEEIETTTTDDGSDIEEQVFEAAEAKATSSVNANEPQQSLTGTIFGVVVLIAGTMILGSVFALAYWMQRKKRVADSFKDYEQVSTGDERSDLRRKLLKLTDDDE
ncbi:chitin deacetylase [Chytriomyces hyalinus]|nr:chitin deacetylase [Chytriomyces hyalinus]